MISRVSTFSPISYRGVQSDKPVKAQNSVEPAFKASVQEINNQAIENIPVAKKLADDKTRSITSLSILASGAVIGPLAGMGLDKLSGAEGPIVRASRFISKHTIGFDNKISKFNIGSKINRLADAVKRKIFKPANLEKFKAGFKEGGGLMEAARAVEKNAIKAGKKSVAEAARRSVETLNNVNHLGIFGRIFGKTAIFFKKNCTGALGIINGIFATMTVNSVVQAKKGEKVSTLMEELLGTWVGSIGGFRLFENILKGADKFINHETGKVVGKGVLPFAAKVINKIPAKGFLFPMIGAMLCSSVLQKVSHKIFGKPTKEEPQVIDSVDSLNSWLIKTGWTIEEIRAAEAAQQAQEAK